MTEKKFIHNVETGEIRYEELTEAEIEKRNLDAEKELAEKNEKVLAKETAFNKLIALGLTKDDLEAILG